MPKFLKVFVIFLFTYQIIQIRAAEITLGQTEVALDEYWKFKPDYNNQGEAEKWFSINFNDTGWDKMHVPGNWDLHNQYANYKGKAWYRTQFLTPQIGKENIILSFGEVGMTYKVYLNEKLIGKVICGNYVQNFDITNFLQPSRNNHLAVEIDNSLSWGAYWNWGGFRRSVKLIIREPIVIERQEIIANPDLKSGSAEIITTVFIKNSTLVPQKIQLHQQIYFEKKEVQGIKSSELLIAANATTSFTFKTKLINRDVNLWHFDHPNLYESLVSLTSNNQIMFRHNDRFGIRKIEIEGYQFKLNGESVRLAGYNWVADDRTTGSTLPEFRFKEDIDLMKASGANFARLSHRPLPQDVLDYIDEKGILIFSEFNNWPAFMNGSSEEPQLFAKQLIQQSFNHPCIIGWSVGNENGNLKENPEVNDYTKSIIKYIKTNLDSTRLVNYVSNTADYQDNDAALYGDIIMINKYGNYEKGVDELKKRYPNKPVFMSEYGSHTDNLIYDTPDKTTFKSLMVDNLTAKENLFGYSIWTFNDYRSNYQAPNPLTTTPVHQNRQWGSVDVYRNKKRAYVQMQNFYAPIRKLALSVQKLQNGIMQSNIALQPRYKIDIPAYILRGYKLIWETRNVDNKVGDAGLIKLPEIMPGADSLLFKVTWKINGTAFFKVSLMSPTGYIVLDSTIHLQIPPAPKVESFIVSPKEARIVFDRNDFTKEFIVKYKAENGIIKSLPPTINHYQDITNLSLGKKYEIWVTGINSFGESQPSVINSFTPMAGYQNLPPIIWQSEPANNSFFVGYSYHYSDIQYDIRYGSSLTNKDKWNSITSNNFGMMQVPNLINNQIYYYQIARRQAFTHALSSWSEVKSVVPNAGHQYGKIVLKGFKQDGKHLLLFVSPSKNAIGYRVTCVTAMGKKVYEINQALVDIISIELVSSAHVQDVEIEALDSK